MQTLWSIFWSFSVQVRYRYQRFRYWPLCFWPLCVISIRSHNEQQVSLPSVQNHRNSIDMSSFWLSLLSYTSANSVLKFLPQSLMFLLFLFSGATHWQTYVCDFPSETCRGIENEQSTVSYPFSSPSKISWCSDLSVNLVHPLYMVFEAKSYIYSANTWPYYFQNPKRKQLESCFFHLLKSTKVWWRLDIPVYMRRFCAESYKMMLSTLVTSNYSSPICIRGATDVAYVSFLRPLKVCGWKRIFWASLKVFYL